MWHKPCRTFHPWCPCIKTRCLYRYDGALKSIPLRNLVLFFIGNYSHLNEVTDFSYPYISISQDKRHYICLMHNRLQGPLLHWYGLTLIPALISNHMDSKGWDEITYPFLNINGCTVEVWELISYFIPHFVMDAVIYPCWDQSETVLVKGAPGRYKRASSNIFGRHALNTYSK